MTQPLCYIDPEYVFSPPALAKFLKIDVDCTASLQFLGEDRLQSHRQRVQVYIYMASLLEGIPNADAVTCSRYIHWNDYCARRIHVNTYGIFGAGYWYWDL